MSRIRTSSSSTAWSGTPAKLYDAFPADGVGTKAAVSAPTVLILTPDDIADNATTTATVTVGGDHVVSTINSIGDQDFFKVELQAGKTYDIGEYLVTGGPSGVPLNDAFVEIYDASGNLVGAADGGGPNTPEGLDALLTFTAQTSGTYYINARAFDQDGTNGTTGDGVGDYELFVNDVTGQPHYVPYYDISSPLNSIDWGTQVDRTSRNPDGQEGPRVTGNPYTGVGIQPLRDRGQERHHRLFRQGRRHLHRRGPDHARIDRDHGRQGHGGLGKAGLLERSAML